jgi:hypothetical protein
MPLRLRRAPLAALLLLTAGAPAVRAAAPRAAQFVFTGTVEEPGGRPVRGAKVALDRVPGRAAVTDAAGRFTVSFTVPDLSVLVAEPLRLVLRVRYRGWNFPLPSDGGAAAVQLRLLRPLGGPEQLEIGSNDPELARATAAFFRVPGDVMVALHVRFVRELGPEDRSEPKLTAIELLPVAQAPGPAVAAPAPAWSADSLRPATPPPAELRTTVSAPPASAPAAVSAPPPQPRPERPESMRLFPSAPEPGTTVAPPPAGSPAAPGSVGTAATPGPAVPSPGAMSPRGAARSRHATPVRSPGGRSPKGRTAKGRAPGGAPRESSSSAVIRVSVRPDTSAPRDPGPFDAGGTIRVVHGVAVTETTPPTAGPACECHVKGTVEVRSDLPLGAPVRVRVGIADAPLVADTVGLEMGAPRAFDLGRLPCGGYRLEVQPLTSRRFTVVTPSLGAFACVAGVREFRVVLEPR